MYCLHCGADRPPNASFCPACGRAVESPTGGSATFLGAHTVTTSDAAFFDVGTTKLVLMTVSTFGMYELYWLYKNWSVEQELSGDSLSPFWRAFFAPIFIYALAARVRDRAISMDLPSTLQPALIAVAFILLTLAARAPDPFWLIATLAGLALIPVQRDLARVNAARGLGPGKEARYTPINIVWLTLSALLWLLVIAGMLLPEVE